MTELEAYTAVVLNGDLGGARSLALLDGAERIVAADGGANRLAANHRRPSVVVGDMDSIAPDLLRRLEDEGCRIERHRPNKDETDGELAVREALVGGGSPSRALRLVILGAWGGRVDHTLANVALLAMPELAAVDAALYDGLTWLRLVRDGLTLEGSVGDIVSLLPWGGDAVGVTLSGLAYPLVDACLPLGAARGMSNVMLGSAAQVALRAGALLVAHTPRADLEDEGG